MKERWIIHFPVSHLFGYHTWATWAKEKRMRGQSEVGVRDSHKLSAPLFEMSWMDDFPKWQGEKCSILAVFQTSPAKLISVLGWVTFTGVKEVKKVKTDFSLCIKKGRALKILRRTYTWENQQLHAYYTEGINDYPEANKWGQVTKQGTLPYHRQSNKEEFAPVPLLHCLNIIGSSWLEDRQGRSQFFVEWREEKYFEFNIKLIFLKKQKTVLLIKSD